MKKILIILTCILVSILSLAQESKPNKTIRVIQSPLFYRAPIDSAMYLYGNDGRGGMWNRIATYKDIADTIKWYVPYDGALKDLHMGYHTVKATSFILDTTYVHTGLEKKGTMSWNEETQSVETHISNDLHLNNGEELWVPLCYNNSGVDILNGQPVYVSGAYVSNPTILLASNLTYDESRLIGVATQDIPNGSYGRVTRFGYVNDIDLSSCTPGSNVYLGDKVITHIRPTGGTFPVVIGKAITCTTSGRLLVYPQGVEYTAEVNKVDGWPSYLQGEQTNLSFVDLTRTLSIAPVSSSFYFYQGGVKYIKTGTQSISISDVEGLHLIHYDIGVLTELINPSVSQILDVIRNKVTVSVVYWDATNKTAIYIGNERHTFHFPSWVHAYTHNSFGTQYSSGLGLTNITLGLGTTNADAQFGVESGSIADEDIITTTDVLSSTAGIPIFYRLGSGMGLWRKVFRSGYAFLNDGTTGLAMYNLYSGGTWSITSMTNNYYRLIHVFATNDINTSNRVIAMSGVAQYASAAAAEAGVSAEIANIYNSNLPFAEVKHIGSLILHTKTGLGNTVNARYVAWSDGSGWKDFRKSSVVGSAGGGSGAGSFLGLSDTPDSYAGQVNKIVGVSSLENGVEFKPVTIDGSTGVVNIPIGATYNKGGVPIISQTIDGSTTTLTASQKAIKDYADTKEPAFSKGNLNSGSAGITVSNGTNRLVAGTATVSVTSGYSIPTATQVGQIHPQGTDIQGITRVGDLIGLTQTTTTISIADKQPQLDGIGFVKANGTTINYDNSTYEPTFSKNTAFNKNFGTTAGTVLEGRTFGTAANNNFGDFIQNQNSSAQSASAWINGNITIDGNLFSNKDDDDNIYTGGAIWFGKTFTSMRIGTDKSYNIDTYNSGVYTNAFKLTQQGSAIFASTVQATYPKFTQGAAINTILTGDALGNGSWQTPINAFGGSFIQNQNSSAQSANMWISGIGKFGTEVVTKSTIGYTIFRNQNSGGDFYFGIDSSTGSDLMNVGQSTNYARVINTNSIYPLILGVNNNKVVTFNNLKESIFEGSGTFASAIQATNAKLTDLSGMGTRLTTASSDGTLGPLVNGTGYPQNDGSGNISWNFPEITSLRSTGSSFGQVATSNGSGGIEMKNPVLSVTTFVKEKSPTGIFNLAHSSVVYNNQLFVGERAANPKIVKFSNLDDLSVNSSITITGSGSSAAGLESGFYVSSIDKVCFFVRDNTAGFNIVEVTPSTMAYTVHNFPSVTGLYGVANTDGTYIYYANYNSMHKIRVSDWTIIQSTTLPANIQFPHAMMVNAARGEFYLTGAIADPIYMAKISTADISSYTQIDLSAYITKATDDMCFYDDGTTCKVFIGGENFANTQQYCGVSIETTNGNALSQIHIKPSYGLFIDGVKVFSCSLDGYIQTFSALDPTNVSTFTLEGFSPNEVLPISSSGRTFFTHWDTTNSIMAEFYVPVPVPAPSGLVTSVFGRTGVVVANTGDYSASQITNAADKSTTNTFSDNITISKSSSPYFDIYNTGSTSTGGGFRVADESGFYRGTWGYNNNTNETYFYNQFNDPYKYILNNIEQFRMKTDGVFETRDLSANPSAARSGFGGFYSKNGVPFYINSAGTVTQLGGTGGSMVYPTGSGLAVVSGGTAWGTTIAFNGNTGQFLNGNGSFSTPTFSSQWTTDSSGYGISYANNVGIGSITDQNFRLRVLSSGTSMSGALISGGSSASNFQFATSNYAGNITGFIVRGDGTISMPALALDASPDDVVYWNGGVLTHGPKPSGSGGGSVTSFSAGDLSPLFTTTETNPTTTPALSFTAVSQAANTGYFAPNGTSGVPGFRKAVVGDISATGTPSASTYLRGDGSWSTPAGATNYWMYSAPNLYPNNTTDNVIIGTTSNSNGDKLKVVASGGTGINSFSDVRALYAESSGYDAITGKTQSSSYSGIMGLNSGGGTAITALSQVSSTSSVNSVMLLSSTSSSTPIAGSGTSITFAIPDQSSTAVSAGLIKCISTLLPNNGNVNSDFKFTLTTGLTKADVFTIKNNGNTISTGSTQVGNDSSTATSSNVGAIRYRTSGNNSYCEMVMQTGASTYAWVIIKQNSW